MQIDTRIVGEHLIVQTAISRLDAEVAMDFRQQMVDLVNQGHRKIVLNLSEVEFIDSSGLGAIVSVLKTMTRDQGELSVCNANDSIMSMFRLTRMDKVFAMYADVKDALVAISS